TTNLCWILATMNKVGLIACLVIVVVLGTCMAEPEPGKKGKGVYYSRPVYSRPAVYYQPRPVYRSYRPVYYKSKGYKGKGRYGRDVAEVAEVAEVDNTLPFDQPSYSSGYGDW
ncbi:unnamed protein product, partial [Meganyctiphanes norvegica]